ncbi:sodium:calcium antiporter [Candidatus Woesearchaeota archaeon]|nr:sodium:calcium antiporter [Candidatus Woesearchaeota archaeon]
MISDSIALLIAGLISLWFGSDFVVTAAKDIAYRLRVSPLFVGLVITAIGTSLPEIANNIMTGIANLSGESSGIGLGNVLGANMANITLLLGAIALAMPFSLKKQRLSRDGGVMIAALLLLFAAAADLRISRLEAGFLLFAYLLYLLYLFKYERVVALQHKPGKSGHPLADAGLLAVGLAMVLGGSYLAVHSGVAVARLFAIPAYLIGLFLGIGTTLPELSISLRAALRKYYPLSLGNLIGSNITNPLLALGSGAVISGYTIDRTTLLFTFPFLLVASVIVFLMLCRSPRMSRGHGILLLLAYLLFMYLSVVIGIA